MARRPIALLVACGLTSLALIVAGILPAELAAANKPAKPNKKPIRNPKFDPSAEQVELFAAVDEGHVAVRLVPKDAMGGNVFIENKTDKPLTVKVPEAVVGVSIHSQFGGGGMQGGGMQGGGGQQAQGGGMGGGQQGGGFGGGAAGGGAQGGGFFSIPPESIVSVPFTSVCLEHGKPEPNSKSKYTLIPVSKFNADPVLYQLLAKVGTGRIDPQAAQAATWHLTDKMSLRELAEKTDSPLGGLEPSPYFSREQLLVAEQLLTQATVQAEEKDSDKADDSADAPKSARVKTK